MTVESRKDIKPRKGHAGYTIFHILEKNPYEGLYRRCVTLSHKPGQYDFLEGVLESPRVSSNSTEVIDPLQSVPGWGKVTFITHRWEDGTELTEGPFRA